MSDNRTFEGQMSALADAWIRFKEAILDMLLRLLRTKKIGE